MEIWKNIEGIPGYQVSNLGRVKSPRQILNPIFNKTYKDTGYYMVKMKEVRHYIHRLVAKAFHPNPESKPHVNHIDCNKANNAASNLEWATASENNIHAFANGKKVPCGEKAHQAKLTEAQAIEIKQRAAQGETTNKISKDYPVAYATVKDIIENRTWKHLNQAA